MKNSTLHPLYPAAQNAPAEMSLSKQRLRVWLRMLDRNRNFLNRLRASLRDDFETTLPRFDVMATLSWHEEGLRMSALSTHMKVSNGNVTGIVESLIREGLVLRKVAPDDKRAATVSLTSLGHQRFQQMAVAHEEWVNGMFANLDSEQLDLLAGLLEQLGEDEE